MLKYAVAYFTALVAMLPLDLLWLRTAGDLVYRPEIGGILTDKPSMGAAASFYLLYAVGIVVFGAASGWRSGAWVSAAVYGALFGFFCYATYDLTNLATLKVWSLKVTLVDIAWGSAITGFSATAAYWVSRQIAG